MKKKGNVDRQRAIVEIEIDWERPWNKKHRLALHQAYWKAPFYTYWEPFLTEVYARTPTHLASFTIDLTIELSRYLGISHTRFLRSSELGVPGHRTERLIAITRHLGCDRYVTGPAAKAYLEEDRFIEAGINLEYISYDYPEYEQLYPPFDPQVSVLDLLLMIGPEAAPRMIWG